MWLVHFSLSWADSKTLLPYESYVKAYVLDKSLWIFSISLWRRKCFPGLKLVFVKSKCEHACLSSSSPLTNSKVQVFIIWTMDSGIMTFCSCSHYTIADTNTQIYSHHIEVKVLLNPFSSFIKLLEHLHDVEGVQGIHYCRSFYTPWKKHRTKH